MASYAIVRMKWKLSKPVLTLFLLGLMIPIHSALLPLFIILRKLRLLNSYGALIIPYVAFALPMAIFIFSGFLIAIPRELEESACLDGCGIYRIFFAIVLPLLKPAIATVSIFTYLASWNELMFAVVFVNDERYKTLTVGIMSMVGPMGADRGRTGRRDITHRSDLCFDEPSGASESYHGGFKRLILGIIGFIGQLLKLTSEKEDSNV